MSASLFFENFCGLVNDKLVHFMNFEMLKALMQAGFGA